MGLTEVATLRGRKGVMRVLAALVLLAPSIGQTQGLDQMHPAPGPRPVLAEQEIQEVEQNSSVPANTIVRVAQTGVRRDGQVLRRAKIVMRA